MNNINIGSYIAINATTISIVVGLVCAYVIYRAGVINKYSAEIISEALSINDIPYLRICYFPANTTDQDEINVLKSIIAEMNNLSISTLVEDKHSSINKPNSPKEIEELFRYLHFLANPYFAIGNEWESNFSIGLEKYIPKDNANRGAEILTVFNLLQSCVLFPEPITNSPMRFKRGIFDKKYFGSIVEVKQWLINLETFVFGFKEFLYYQEFFPCDLFIKSLEERDRELIEKWSKHRVLPSFGIYDPNEAKINFISNSKLIIKLYDILKTKSNQLDFIEKSLLSKNTLAFFVFVLLLLFLSGVVVPIVVPKPSIVFYFCIPFYIYIVSFIVIIFILLRNK